MNKRKWLLIIIFVIGACIFIIVFPPITIPWIPWIEEREIEPRCSPIAWNFSEADLVGTWEAGSPDQMDTLMISADGTYRQVVHVDFAEGAPLDYESDWQPWHLEYSEDNIPYLHLTGMRFCGMNPAISCETRDGGGYDFCQDEYLYMNGEGILVVLSNPDIREIPSTAIRQDYINLFYPLGSENSWVYEFQEP